MPKKSLVERSAAAVEMGRARWKGRSKAERRAHGAMMRAARTAKEKALESKKSA